ncbi:MAG: hexokinase [Deltaproteobacteria bacterium]|jgi:hexokinase|nr:hexokinase [Deltaproteobacteria bacterium]MBT4526242.1 hexokinase [Deltaproteobacteria bacterium]
MNDLKKISQSFLTKYGIDSSCINSASVIDDFLDEMRKGLNGKDSSLPMLPAYIGIDKPLPFDTPVIVLDAGGTNLRACLVTFSNQGEIIIKHLSKREMPGTHETLSEAQFYDVFCDFLKPLIRLSDDIGFCFSYPVEITPEKDGKLLHWTKEIKVPDVVGKYIGKGLANSLAENGHPNKKIIILNDTVATLLAGMAKGKQHQYDGYIGFILGTGTNTAYLENNNNIGKIELTEGVQAINVESGGFKKSPRSKLDKQFDASTNNPSQHIFEKMISGCYLGAIISTVIQTAAKDQLFSPSAKQFLEKILPLETIDISRFIENPHHPESPFKSNDFNDTDLTLLYYIINGYLKRAAKLTAINIASAIIKSGTGKSPLHPICINIDGSTYHKTAGFSLLTETYLVEILDPYDIFYRIIQVDNSPIIGAAIAGLIG